MYVVFASSDLYNKLAIVTIKSLLMNNEDADSIDIFYIGDEITEGNKNTLKELVTAYHRNIDFILFPTKLNDFAGSNRNGQTVFTYCYLQEILPTNIDKVLLLESDAIVTGSLKEFYETDINDYYIAAADDLQSKWYKRKLGMKDGSPYVNCGVVLYNLKKWRDDNITEKITSILKSGEHMFFYDVQDVINYTVEGQVKIFPPRFNSTTAIFLFDYKNMLRYRRPSTHCTETEFHEGRNNPAVVHFTKNQIIQPRPWIEHCTHPYNDQYMTIRKQTIMREESLWKYNPKNLNKFAAWLYTHTPNGFTAFVFGVIHSFLYPLFLYNFLFRDR